MYKNGWRAAGMLLHPTALFSPYGIGDLGPYAYDFARFLKKAGFHFWQILPLSPTGSALGNSPYSAYSAFAGNSLLLSPDLMLRDGWLKESEVDSAKIPSTSLLNYEKATKIKEGLIEQAFQRAYSTLEKHDKFQQFIWDNGGWLNDYAFFIAAKNYFNQNETDSQNSKHTSLSKWQGTWLSWPEELAKRDNSALARWGVKLARQILKEKFAQYLFFSQLAELKIFMKELGLGFIGDASIYVNHDSSDVWAQPWLYQLDDKAHPSYVAGVPPDYFAKDGQLWGNPLFDWEKHADSSYDWWKNRLWHMLGIFDWLRLDHFRAFAAYWQVPASAKTAAEGSWQKGPGRKLFEAAASGSSLNIIAEDLGIITPDVTTLRQELDFPGMRVLQFAFGPNLGTSTHTPYRIGPDNVVYAATHDNNTTRGWFRQEADDLVKNQLNALCGESIDEKNVAWALMKLAFLSPAFLAVVTVQDLLNLNEKARFNTPGTAKGNWRWCLKRPDLLTDALAAKMADLSALSGRDNLAHPNILHY